jgi:two-component system, OmpR family, sensor histidine kinase MprB
MRSPGRLLLRDALPPGVRRGGSGVLSPFEASLSQMTFRRRLILLSAAAVAIAVVLASAIVFVVVRGQLRGQVDDQLRTLVDEIVVPTGVPGSPNRGVLVLPPDPLGRTAGYAQVVQPDGTVVRPRGRAVDVPVSQHTIDAAAGRAHAFFTDENVNDVHVRVYTSPLPTGGAVQAVRSLDQVDRTMRRLGLALLLVSLGGIALAIWLGRLVARAALKPVSQLTSAAEHVARTRDLSRRMDTSGRDELSRLGASFNTMLEALEVSQKAQRQLVADASHELRTPLTSLRTNIEVLAGTDALPPEDRRRLLRDVVGQLDELTVLVSDLVDLARGTEPDLESEDVRLDMVVEDAVERARRHAPDKRFVTDLEPFLVRGVPARLDRAVSNLLDNAAKWSPSGGRIEVVMRDGEVSVRDHGPGIDEADLPFIFDRFYRASTARGLPGSGLGLAIVRQVAESHGGSVSAESPTGGGALLRLRVPRLAV